jgi:amino acid transporter
MSILDASIFGLVCSGGVYAFVYMYPYPQALTPGANIPLIIIFGLVVGLFMWVVYAGFGSAMPRAGGDYLYQTRTLGRLVGFVVPWGCEVIFWLGFVTSGAYVANSLGLAPLAGALGWHSAATWLWTGTGGFVVTVVVISLSLLINVVGLRVYRQLQKFVILPLMALGVITILAVFLVKLNANFVHAFNTYSAGGGITVAQVHAAALKAAYVAPKFSFYHTFVWVAVIGSVIPYTMFSAQGLLGEVKDAGNLRRLFTAFLVPGLILALVCMLLSWVLLQHVVGGSFLNQFATADVSGTLKIPYDPNINIFAEMLAPSKAVAILISLGFIATGFGVANGNFVNTSRIIMAMSLDGLLPSFLSRVSQRFMTPVLALIVYSLGCVCVAAWFNYDVSMELSILSAATVTSLLVMGVTALGMALFPRTASDIYASAPIAGVRIGRVRLGSLVGVVGAVWIAVLTYLALVVPALGLTSETARISLVVAFGSGVLMYYGWGLYRRSRGVDVSLRTREVPPE